MPRLRYAFSPHIANSHYALANSFAIVVYAAAPPLRAIFALMPYITPLQMPSFRHTLSLSLLLRITPHIAILIWLMVAIDVTPLAAITLRRAAADMPASADIG